MAVRNALIVTNTIGMFHFLWSDIDMLNQMGYRVFAMADNSAREEHTLRIMQEKGVTFVDARVDSNSMLSRNNLKFYKQLKQLLASRHFGLVHCHTTAVGLFARLAARKYRRKGTKVIYTTHGLPYSPISSRKLFLACNTVERFASRFCDAIITVNSQDYGYMKATHCRNVFQISGVGLDCRRFRNVVEDRYEFRRKCGVPVDKTAVLAVGRLVHYKNQTIIVKALAELPDKDKFVFVVCGHETTSDPVAQELVDLSEKGGVQTVFIGFHSDMPEVIAACADIGVMPSLREGLGMAGLEMLCEGVPLVGSDVQGIREYLKDGVTGFLCNPFSVEDFKNGIQKLADPDLRRRMKPDCKAMAEKFDISISMAQRRAIYEKILNQ